MNWKLAVVAMVATYRINSTLHILANSHFGVKLVGECGAQGHTAGETCGRIASGIGGTAVLLEVGTSGTPFPDSGLVIQDLGFQDKTGGGLVTGAIHLIGTANFSLINIQCRDITIGYCMQFDGGKTGTDENFTQFGTVVNPKVTNTLYPVQIVPQASEITFLGGDFNCNGLGSVSGPPSIGMDLRASGSLKAGGEFSVFGTHMINCVIGISMYNMANMNFYGILEQPSGPSFGNGIVIDGMLHADKSIIAGSIDGFGQGITLQGAAQNTRILANITNTSKPLVVASTSPPSTLILTPQIYTGTGSTLIGDQMPDLTMPEENPPDAPVTGSRRIYVDKTAGPGDDLTAKHSDGATVDLESGLRSYQGALPAIPGNGSNQTVYTFSVPPLPAGKGIRVRVFWQCTTCAPGGQNKTFTWQFGGGTGTTMTYAAYTSSLSDLSYTELRIFNDPGVQNSQTMFGDAITVGGILATGAKIATASQNTSSARSLTFLYNASSDTITPKGFIVEAIQ